MCMVETKVKREKMENHEKENSEIISKEGIAFKDTDLCEGSKDEEFAGNEEFEMLLADESILSTDAVEGENLEVVEEDDVGVEKVLVNDIVMNSSPGEDVTERENSDLHLL